MDNHIVKKFKHSILKHSKGRSTIEIYVHDQDLQAWLKDNELLFRGEDMKASLAIAKKMRIQNKEHALFLGHLIEKIKHKSTKDTKEVVQEYLNALLVRMEESLKEDLASKKNVEEFYEQAKKLLKN